MPGCALWDAATGTPSVPEAFPDHRSVFAPARSIAIADTNGDGRPEVVLSSDLHLDASTSTTCAPPVPTRSSLPLLDLALPTRSVVSVPVSSTSAFDLLLEISVGDLNGDGHLDPRPELR
jgi:hypothetical protein